MRRKMMYNTFIKEKEAGMKETVFCESTSVTALDGVGERRAAMLEKLGIRTLGDLVSYYPRAYEKRGDVRLLGTAPSDTPAAFLLTVATEVSVVMIRRGLTIAKFRAFDESGSVSVVFLPNRAEALPPRARTAARNRAATRCVE